MGAQAAHIVSLTTLRKGYIVQHRSSAPLIMPWPLVISILGLAFCAWSAYGHAFQICLSAGCEISKDMSIGGISLWWFGCAAFATLIILSFSGRPALGVVVAGAFLVADVALLLLMLMTASCISCLIVALFFALAYTAFRYAGKGFDPVSRSWLVLVWGLFLVANLGGVLRENMTPWAMVEPEQAHVNVYFSPTCPACKEAIDSMASNPTVAFFPVLKQESEFALVAHMADALAEGKNIQQALEHAQNSQEALPKLGFFNSLALRLRLIFNEAYLSRNGINTVPVIEYKGLPAFMAKKSSFSQVIPHSEAPQVPATVAKIPAGNFTLPQGLEPEIFLGSGAFTYTDEPTNASKRATGATQGMDANAPVNNVEELFDTGIAGACGGPQAEPCPE